MIHGNNTCFCCSTEFFNIITISINIHKLLNFRLTLLWLHHISIQTCESALKFNMTDHLFIMSVCMRMMLAPIFNLCWFKISTSIESFNMQYFTLMFSTHDFNLISTYKPNCANQANRVQLAQIIETSVRFCYSSFTEFGFISVFCIQ